MGKDCCGAKEEALVQLRPKQANVLKFALMLNSLMFFVEFAAGLLAKIWVFLIISGPAFSITLAEAQDLAVKASPQLAMIQSEGAESKAKANASAFGYRPEMGIALGGETDGTMKDRDNQPLAFAYVNMTIYDGFRSRILQNAAESQVERSQIAQVWKEREIKRAVEDLFVQVAYHIEVSRIISSELESFDRLKKKALERQRAGMIGEADVAEFEVRKADLSADLEASDLENKNLLRQLSDLIHKNDITGIDGFQLPFIARKRTKVSDDFFPNLSMRILEKDLQTYRFEKEDLSAKWGPKVEFEARAGRLPSEGDWDNKRERMDAQVIAKWNLFNRAQRDAEVQVILSREKTTTLRLEEERNLLRIQIREQLSKLEILERKSEILARSRMTAERYHKITMSEYERGVKVSSDAAHATENLFANSLKSLDLRLEWARRKLLLVDLLQ